jgi:hypothetical protein
VMEHVCACEGNTTLKHTDDLLTRYNQNSRSEFEPSSHPQSVSCPISDVGFETVSFNSGELVSKSLQN